jgi:hypothetical protein
MLGTWNRPGGRTLATQSALVFLKSGERGEPLAGENVMDHVDPWEKAADCERALMLTFDPIYRANLTSIREFWISLAHKRPFLSEADFASEAETIGRLHANLTARSPTH